jgi:hypothetical protein
MLSRMSIQARSSRANGAGTLSALLWGVASFRPDRAPEVTQALNDLAWFLFAMPAGPLGLQILATAIVPLAHSGPDAPFPRWFGYLSLWMFSFTIPGFLVIFFKTGPLAWNGLLGIYLPAVGVAIWVGTLITLLLRAIAHQATAQDSCDQAETATTSVPERG